MYTEHKSKAENTMSNTDTSKGREGVKKKKGRECMNSLHVDKEHEIE